MAKSLHCLVSGRVQGVAFRAFVRGEAQRLGLSGWTRNLFDGRVEVLAQGPDDALETLEARLRQGPILSRVDAVDASIVEHGEAYREFQIIR